jgi:Glycosyl hydrolases family 16/Cellulase (glycosyl hydrolase family 5)
LPTGAGLWPAFWLEPVNGTSACEIDIFEAPFNNPTLIQSSLHGGNGYTTGQVTVPNYSTNFNTYGVNWNAQTITYYVNGQVIGSTPTPASCNTPAFILANLAVGGASWAWSGVPNSSNTWPVNMTIQSITYNPNGPGGVGNDGGTYSGGLAEAGTTAAPQPATTAAVTTPTPTAPATATAPAATTTATVADPPAATDPPATAGSTPSTLATAAAPAAAATPTKTVTTSAQQITPGSGSVTDCAGNTWTINSNNKILENGTPVLDGGDTAALTLDGSCTVYGLSNGNNGSKVGWFTLSSVTPGSNQTWNYMGATAIPPTTGTSTPAAAASAVSIAPLAVQSCPATAAGSGGFHVAGGQIIGPNGQVWIARGVDVHAANLSAAAQQLPIQFPGVNLVRVAAGDYEPLEDPSSFAGAVTTLTSQGTVVEFTDYSNSLGTGGGGGQGVVFTGALLANELAWFSAMASYYKNNPYVWLGTNNEPTTTGGSLSNWQLATYQAIRNTGNTNPIFLEPSGSRPPGYGGTPLQAAMNPADYTGMTNVIWDPHVYGYQTNYSTDPGTIAAEIVALVAASQTIQSADGVVPAVIGEYGPEGSNGMQTVTGVINAGASGTTGSAAWVWDTQGTVGGPSGDPTGTTYGGLLSGGQITTYGQMVQLFVNTNVVPLSNCQLTAQAQQNINTDTAQLAANPPTSTTPDAATTAPATMTGDPTVAALNQQADAAVAQGNAIAAAAQAAMQATQ